MNYPKWEDLLVKFCKIGDMDELEKLIKWYPKIDIQYHNGEAFRSACYRNRLGIVKYLMETFPNIDYSQWYEDVLINTRDNNLQVAEFLIDKIQDNNLIENVFIEACRIGNLQIAKMLLIKFPNINYHVNDERLFRRACSGGYLDLVQWLVENFTDIDYHSCNDDAFKNACLYKHLSIVKLLLNIFSENNYRINIEKLFGDNYSKSKKVPEWLKQNFLETPVLF